MRPAHPQIIDRPIKNKADTQSKRKRASLLNIYEVNKHIEININIYNVVIYILLGFLAYILINTFAKHFFVNSIMVNTFSVITLTFLIFAYLGGFGENN